MLISIICLFIHVLFIAVQSLTGQCLIENCSAWSLRAGAAGICRCHHHINVPKETVRNMVRANSCLVSMALNMQKTMGHIHPGLEPRCAWG